MGHRSPWVFRNENFRMGHPPNGEVMANYGKHEVGHDAGNADVAPNPNNSSDPMVSPSDGQGNKEYTPPEAEKLKSSYNRENEKEKKPNQ